MIFSMIFGWLKLALFGFCLAEITARIGVALLGIFSSRPLSPSARFGVGLLLGLGFLGTMLAGLAFAGLFYPSTIVLAAILPLLLSIKDFGARLVTIEAVREGGIMAPGLALMPAAVAALPDILTPVLNHDSYVYHMGLPWQSLMLHRIPVSDVSATLHFPLPVDMTFVFSFLTGDDRLAKIVVLLAFLAAGAVFSDWCRIRRIPYAGWMGPLLALSSGILLSLVIEAKNDVPAAALFVAGAVMCLRRKWATAAMLFGFSVAAKEIYWPIVAIFIAMNCPPSRGRLPVLALIILPIAPWYAKNILATGAPLYPFLPDLFGADHGGELSRQIHESFLRGAGVARMKAIMASFGTSAREHLPLLVALAAALFTLKAMRRILAACFLAVLATVIVINIPRYWLPAIWLMSLISAMAITRVTARYRTWTAAAFALLSVGHTLYILDPFSQSWGDLALSRSKFLAKRLTTYEETVRKMGEIGPKRLIEVGERLVYRMPARVIYGGQVREVPLVWRLANESASVERLAAKFRQLGASHLLYNYISAQWIGRRYGDYPWNKRMIRIYIDYCKMYQEPIWQTRTNNYDEGGFVLYRLHRRPSDNPPERIWFAPGTEQVYTKITKLRDSGRYKEFLELALKAFEVMPDVGNAWNKVGYAYYLLGDFKNSYKYLGEFTKEGMLDEFNLVAYGISALETGQILEAERLLGDSLGRTPVHRKLALKHLSRIVRKYQP